MGVNPAYRETTLAYVESVRQTFKPAQLSMLAGYVNQLEHAVKHRDAAFAQLAVLQNAARRAEAEYAAALDILALDTAADAERRAAAAWAASDRQQSPLQSASQAVAKYRHELEMMLFDAQAITQQLADADRTVRAAVEAREELRERITPRWRELTGRDLPGPDEV